MYGGRREEASTELNNNIELAQASVQGRLYYWKPYDSFYNSLHNEDDKQVQPE
jgi:hypothetical protein